MFKVLVLFFLTCQMVQADYPYRTSSMQGFTGVINTPNAEVIEDGQVEFQFSNQIDTERGFAKNELKADQYFVNFGFLQNLEVIGRLVNIDYREKRGGWHDFLIRDLSASFKYQIPFYHKYLPKFAIGIQDLGGQVSFYDSKYIVATKEYKFLRASIGYGFDSINVLDGTFGSLEVRATDWATLLAEYDSKDTQVGLRLNTPTGLSKYFDVAFLAKANLDDDSQRYSFGLNVRMALGDNHHDNRQVHSQSPMRVGFTASQTLPSKAHQIKDKLVEIGLENIDIQESADTIYVAYENNIFEHNELDALGVVLGALVDLNIPQEKFDIVIKKSNQKVKKVSGSLSAYKKLVFSLSDIHKKSFIDSLTVTAPSGEGGQNLAVDGANSSYLKTRLTLYPGLNTYVGTELGTLDYLLSLRTAFHWNLYKGFDLGVMADFPALMSDDFEEGGYFRSDYKGNQLKSVLLHRSDIFGDFINVASAGLFRKYWVAFENLTYAHGNHTLGLKYAYFRTREKITPPNGLAYYPYHEEKDIYIARYSYYYDRFDALFELTGGKYFNDDKGFEVTAKRYFGDTAVSFFYQHADEKYVGIAVELPLTPRKIEDSYLQVKGKHNYKYGIRTTVNDPDNVNYLEPGGLLKASREFDIEPNFLNKNRLSSDYVKKHVLRLRDASLRYVLER